MPGEFMVSPRRSAATALVWDFMKREEHPDGLRSARTPVVLFTGVRGAGQAELLADLRGLLGTVPCAYIDAGWPFKSTLDMLALLAYDLNQKSGYGKLAYPRLLTGEIVIDAGIDIDPLDRARARQQVVALLADHRHVKGVLEDSISRILQGALAPALAHSPPEAAGLAGAVADVVSDYGTKPLLGRLAATRYGRAVLLGRGQEWWGHQDRGLRNDPIDELVNLRLAADRARAQRPCDDPGTDRRDAAADLRKVVTKRLWEAYLADLRDSFGDRRRAINWTRNCVLLLGNADTPVARAFLEELVSVRRDRARGEPDPLTVVAASHGGLAAEVSEAGVTPLSAASPGHYRERTGSAVWWYPVLLPALSWSQTTTMVYALELPGINAEVVTAAVRGFTRGHPAATRVLLEAMAEHSWSAVDVNLPGLLTVRAGTEPGRTVQLALLDCLLAPPPGGDDAPADDLATCAAARQMAAALRLAADSGLAEQLPGEVTAIFAPEFWPGDPAGGATVLHPLLRRLLLQRLAARTAGDKASWARVHLWLRGRALEDGHAVTALYHALALAGTEPDELAAEMALCADSSPPAQAGPPPEADPLEHEQPLEHVARQLACYLKSDGAARWLRRVASVAAAPARIDPARRTRDEVRKLTQWVGRHEEPTAPIARYVAYCWLGADPLRAPSWSWLLGEMACELDRIAPYSDDEGLSVLRAEARRYRYLADGDWQDIEDFWVSRQESADEANEAKGAAGGN